MVAVRSVKNEIEGGDAILGNSAPPLFVADHVIGSWQRHVSKTIISTARECFFIAYAQEMRTKLKSCMIVMRRGA